MVYQGSKSKLIKYIVPILQKCINDNNITTYIEPFVGGANVIDHITCKNKIGSDNNSELITLLTYMRDNPDLNIFPEDCSFEHYKEVREARKNNDNKYSTAYIAGIGYFASYGGRYFDGGYGRSDSRSIYKDRLNNVRKQAAMLKNIEFRCTSYEYWSDCKGCVIYLDPPYRGTKPYNGKTGFDYDKFYDFVRELSKNNFVFISEYSMPEDFEVIWQRERKVCQKSDRTEGDLVVEKLFVHRK